MWQKVALKGPDRSIRRLLAHPSKPVFRYCCLAPFTPSYHTKWIYWRGMSDQSWCLFSEVCSYVIQVWEKKTWSMWSRFWWNLSYTSCFSSGVFLFVAGRDTSIFCTLLFKPSLKTFMKECWDWAFYTLSEQPIMTSEYWVHKWQSHRLVPACLIVVVLSFRPALSEVHLGQARLLVSNRKLFK